MAMPIGPLMTEHRLIERMIDLIRDGLEKIAENGEIDPGFIDQSVEFIQIYADKLHHGKEEGILFRELANENLSDEHQKTMNELIEEHKWGRRTVKKLKEARDKIAGGDSEALTSAEKHMKDLAEFYPRHIEKEDKHFFIRCMEYFSKEEQQAILLEEMEFDRNFIHDLFRERVTKLESQR